MRLAASTCTSFAPVARGHLLRRGSGGSSLSTRSIRSALSRSQQGAPYRQLHSLLQTGGYGVAYTRFAFSSPAAQFWKPKLRAPGFGGVPITPLRHSQIRSLKKANYIERIGDNERTEEILEKLEVRDDDETDTESTRQVLDGNGERPTSQDQKDQGAEQLTTGM